MTRPPLSVIIPTREPWPYAKMAVDSLVPQARECGAEILVVDGVGRAFESDPGPPVRWVRVQERDMFALHAIGLREASGEIVAIGEDHLEASPDWCAAVIRAHAEHPDAQAVAGTFVNATTATLWQRAHFLAFAAAYAPPLRELPPDRAPPIATLSFKRHAVVGLEVGALEVEVVPRLFHEHRMAVDDRIVGLHHQPFAFPRAMREHFDNGRTIAGYLRPSYSWAQRRQRMGWALRLPAMLVRQARTRHPPKGELAAVAVIASATAAGDLLGILFGTGSSPNRFG